MKIKKLLALGMAALTLVAFSAGCGKTDTTKQELPKKVVIGLDDTFAPMGFRNDKGELVGFDIDMAKEAAKRAGMEVEFKPIDWDSKEAELKSKHIDILWNGLTILEERKDKILFSDPYMADHQMIVVRADSPISNFDDLKGKIVGTQQASTADFYFQKPENKQKVKEVKFYGDFVNAFVDLELGRVDALIVDEIMAGYTLTQKQGFKMVDSGLPKDNVGVGFRIEDTALRDKINTVLAEMKKDGTADKIATKWFGNANLISK